MTYTIKGRKSIDPNPNVFSACVLVFAKLGSNHIHCRIKMEVVQRGEEPEEFCEWKAIMVGIVDEVPKTLDNKHIASKMSSEFPGVHWRSKQFHGPKQSKVGFSFCGNLAGTNMDFRGGVFLLVVL